ncbi:MAG: hypothetical protein EOQ39_19035 [Mesorhizobium sp.]|uniref:hypothetical protein n=1 Tax=Mesorhizobium sp. TaxID=1871066 RepID=UPI000FE5E6C6|nr:hypothetical protein [Mesorhizobium sp.]RWB08732.1 MAG: hypothetical protein EOQ37_04300 [Mesorhizobium sp.]RWB13615.1 MAG: hypothetical protein EOQ39_19035 [Mesorhizobium sp.]
MQQNLKVQADIVNELLGLEAKLEPLEARKEELKEALRGFGAAAYPVFGVGEVTVSQPSVSVKKGTQMVVDETQLSSLSDATVYEIIEKKFVVYEDVMSRAAKSRVEIKLAA